MSGRLLDEIGAAIPPLAATAIVSPVLLGEAFVGAFAETGRDLVVPGVILLVGVTWISRSSRRTGRIGK
jgi:hypothetical protein